MDNSTKRLNDVFFYGLYMDEEILKNKGVEPRNKRKALVHGYILRLGNMATLLRKENAVAYGMVYSLTHEEIDMLYKNSGLTQYVNEALMVELEDKSCIVALCSVLLDAPKADESNDEYYQKLVSCMKKYELEIPTKV
ncbi:gamma-glutamylcyclotransferase family protein [Sulfurovum sp.]|uniref:gamma-glutamylcyclotransferase family protein n=1 Tax=Sulfurovum sp. TaxID=1969726 RepID=UPI0025DDACE5|nr:gamma-glutamylcyclotransferase family protein [Sulfurovum sp.]